MWRVANVASEERAALHTPAEEGKMEELVSECLELCDKLRSSSYSHLLRRLNETFPIHLRSRPSWQGKLDTLLKFCCIGEGMTRAHPPGGAEEGWVP